MPAPFGALYMYILNPQPATHQFFLIEFCLCGDDAAAAAYSKGLISAQNDWWPIESSAAAAIYIACQRQIFVIYILPPELKVVKYYQEFLYACGRLLRVFLYTASPLGSIKQSFLFFVWLSGACAPLSHVGMEFRKLIFLFLTSVRRAACRVCLKTAHKEHLTFVRRRQYFSVILYPARYIYYSRNVTVSPAPAYIFVLVIGR